MASNMGKIQCLPCGGWFRRKLDGQPYKHDCTPMVSVPPPTVDETTTQGDDVNPDAEAHLDAADMMVTDPDYIDYERRVTYGGEKGPWFGAMYESRCSVNDCLIEEGDRIRADGEGGYECESCGDSQEPDELMVGPRDDVDWQTQASAAARRHQDMMGAAGATVIDPVPAADTLTQVQGTAPVRARRLTAAPRGPQTAPAYVDELQLPTAHQFTDPTPPPYGHDDPGYIAPAITADQFMDPASTEDVQPVMGVNGQPKEVRRDHMKRYAVALPGETTYRTYKNGKPWGYTRATTFNKAATDKKNINDWGKRNVVIGAARRRDLLLQAHGLTHERDKDRLNAIVVELEEAAGAKVGSDLGTYLHEFTEYMDAGLKTYHDAPAEFQDSLYQYANVLNNAGLEPIRSLIERTTIIREYGWVCGTFDRIFYHRPSGQYVIGDLKTGKTMDYGKNEIDCQLWTYAHGVNQHGVYDWNTDTWEKPDAGPDLPVLTRVSEAVGVVIHMPVQGPQEGTVQLLWADLENGARHAELCHAVRSQPKGKMKPWGNGPAPLAPPSWEDRFRAVRSGEEASALWREAKEAGIKGRHLEDYIALARQSLRLISFGTDVKG